MGKENKPWNSGVSFALEMHNEVKMHITANIIHTAVEKNFTDEEIAFFLDISVEEVQEIHTLSRELLWGNGDHFI